MEPLDRRTLLTGLAAVICAPAIVRATSLMPVKVLKAVRALDSDFDTEALRYSMGQRYAEALMRSFAQTKWNMSADVLNAHYERRVYALGFSRP